MAATSANPLDQTSFTRRVLGLVVLGFMALLAAGIAAAWVQGRNTANSDMVEHTLQVEARVGEFTSAIERTETARRGLLLSGGAIFRTRMNEASQVADRVVGELARLTADNPAQQQRIEMLRKLRAEQRKITAAAKRLPLTTTSAQLDAFEFDQGVVIARDTRAAANAMLDEERKLLEVRQAEQARTQSIFYTILTAAGVLLVLVAAATVAIMLRYTRELTSSREELAHLNDDLEMIVDARTAELQRANAEIQRFAYIVSHDLRSPLVNVMGFTAELDAARGTVGKFLDKLDAEQPGVVEEEARLAVAQDLPEAIGFIRTSTQKMDRLINAILRLSREGRRTLMPEQIDANVLVQTIVDAMHHRVTDAGAEIAAERLPSIVTDRLALEQILSNLIENAVKYLQPGRPGFIKVTGRKDRDRVVYEVTDNGRGIDPRDHERVFDLFRRSGQQDQPGEGIGLAHVRALAYRLGGLIEVRSALDRGSTFRLSLPMLLKPGEEK